MNGYRLHECGYIEPVKVLQQYPTHVWAEAEGSYRTARLEIGREFFWTEAGAKRAAMQVGVVA